MDNLTGLHDLPYYMALLGYLGIFLFFITVDQFTPIPEEVSLLTIGYLASKDLMHPVIAGIVALLAFLTVDSVYYLLLKSGQRLGGRFRKKMESSFLHVIQERFSRNFPKTLFVLCFIPRMRMWAPIVAGIVKIPYRRFIGYDALSLALFTSVYISAGHFFHKGMHRFLAEMEEIHNVIFTFCMVILAIVIFVLIKKYRHEQQG